MKHLTKLTVSLITIALVGCQQIPFFTETPEQPAFISSELPGTPLNQSALTRLSKAISVEIVIDTGMTASRYAAKGSGVIIAKKSGGGGFTYYVLTANHILDFDEGNFAFIRNEKPGEIGERLPLKVIKRYPKEDLAVLAFLSFKDDYQVAELGEARELNNNSQVYVTGWPGKENRQGFQFSPAEVMNPQAGDNFTYEPVEPGEDVYKGMSGGAVLNEAGQLVGIHVGLTRLGGDGKGVLISTFLRMVPPEVEELLVMPPPPTPEIEEVPVPSPSPTISPVDSTSADEQSFVFLGYSFGPFTGFMLGLLVGYLFYCLMLVLGFVSRALLHIITIIVNYKRFSPFWKYIFDLASVMSLLSCFSTCIWFVIIGTSISVASGAISFFFVIGCFVGCYVGMWVRQLLQKS